MPLLLEQPLQLNFASVTRRGVSLMTSMLHANCVNLQRRPMASQKQGNQVSTLPVIVCSSRLLWGWWRDPSSAPKTSLWTICLKGEVHVVKWKYFFFFFTTEDIKWSQSVIMFSMQNELSPFSQLFWASVILSPWFPRKIFLFLLKIFHNEELATCLTTLS